MKIERFEDIEALDKLSTGSKNLPAIRQVGMKSVK
jgi:hypothetical protein